MSRTSAVRAIAFWKHRTTRHVVAVVIAFVAMAGPAISVGPDGVDPADVEAKAETLEIDELLVPDRASLGHGALAVVDLGPHDVAVLALVRPFLEVPEDPPKAA